MASIDFKKIKDKKQLQALLRHSEKEKRLKSRHTNRDIDKNLTNQNDSYLKLDYKGLVSRFEERIKFLDNTTNKNKRKDRVECVSLVIPSPFESPDDPNNKAWFDEVYKIFVNKFGKDNIIDMIIHKDEVHNYIDARTGEKKVSRWHAHCFVIPELEGKLLAKKFTDRKSMTSLNNIVHDMTKSKFNTDFLLGKGNYDVNDYKDIETLKGDSFIEEYKTLKSNYGNLKKKMDKLYNSERALQYNIKNLENAYEEKLNNFNEKLNEKNNIIKSKETELNNINKLIEDVELTNNINSQDENIDDVLDINKNAVKDIHPLAKVAISKYSKIDEPILLEKSKFKKLVSMALERFKDIAGIEKRLKERENSLSKKERNLQERENSLNERERIYQNKQKKLDKDESAFSKIKKMYDLMHEFLIMNENNKKVFASFVNKKDEEEKKMKELERKNKSIVLKKQLEEMEKEDEKEDEKDYDMEF